MCICLLMARWSTLLKYFMQGHFGRYVILLVCILYVSESCHVNWRKPGCVDRWASRLSVMKTHRDVGHLVNFTSHIELFSIITVEKMMKLLFPFQMLVIQDCFSTGARPKWQILWERFCSFFSFLLFSFFLFFFKRNSLTRYGSPTHKTFSFQRFTCVLTPAKRWRPAIRYDGLCRKFPSHSFFSCVFFSCYCECIFGLFFQLICPSKREVMVFGSFKQAGTLLPKAPKGWGWRTALLFDELADLLQGGALRVAAVVQVVWDWQCVADVCRYGELWYKHFLYMGMHM